ncbi:MAG: hypothetical protein NVS1B11_36280 [Terriglobales bacterium]
MAASFGWDEDNGALATGKGTTRTASRTDNNWKNIDDSTTAYTANPITAGNNSFEKYQSAHFSGTYNQILSGLWAHTAGVPGTGVTIKGINSVTYATPATAANAALTVDMTTAIAIGSGAAVLFGITGPEAAGKAASTTGNPAWSQYLITQMQTTTAAAAGDIPSQILSISYSEN